MDASELLELKRKELEEKKRRRAEMRTKIEEQRKALAERAEAEKEAAEKAAAERAAAEDAGDGVPQGVADELEDILGSLLEFAGPDAGDAGAEGGAHPLDSARSVVTEDDVDDEDDASASASGSRVSETPEQEGCEKEESEVCQWLDDVLLSDLGTDANGAEDLFDADEDVSLEALQAMHTASHSSPALPLEESVSPSAESSLPPIVVSTADDKLRLASSESAVSREAKKGGNVKKKKSKKLKSDDHSAEAPAEGRVARSKTADPTPKRRSTTVSIRNFISQAVTKDKKQAEDKDAEDMKLSDGTAFEWKKKAEAEGVVDVQNLSDVDKIRFEALRFKRENERKTLNAEFFSAFTEAKKTSRRLCIIEEIVSSEREYVEDLTMLIDFFLVPLRAAQLPVNLSLIFGNVELLLAIHQDMLASLDSRVREAAAKLTATDGAEDAEGAQGDESMVPSIAVADVFLPMADNLLSYDQYCMNHRKGVDALVAAENSRPAFAQKISQCRFELHKVGVQHHLKDFLIKPVQRICKYPLLFRELLGETEADHPDYAALQCVLEKLDDVARRINEQKASADNRDRLNTIEKKVDGFPGRLDGDGRHLVHEGMMDKMNPRGKVQRRQYFLFNDLLIWCKPNPIRRGQYAYKGYIKLDRCVVREPTDNQGYRCMFEIIKLETKKVYQLIPLSAGEKKVWMAKIEKIVDSFLEQMASPRKVGGGSKKPTGENPDGESVPPVKIPPLGGTTPKRRGNSRIISADVDRLTARVDSLEKELAASNALNEELLKRLSAVEERLSMLDGGEVGAKRSPSSSAAPVCEEAKSNPSDHIDDDYDEEYESE